MITLRALRNRWRSRRADLAFQQLEAGELYDPLRVESTDAIVGGAYMARRALANLINPKAKTKTEWRGD